MVLEPRFYLLCRKLHTPLTLKTSGLSLLCPPESNLAINKYQLDNEYTEARGMRGTTFYLLPLRIFNLIYISIKWEAPESGVPLAGGLLSTSKEYRT